jgi:uncharacterized protein GlcG (DUF336 family)
VVGSVTLEQAEQIVDVALGRAAEAAAPPLTIAVLDAGGHLVILKRQDGSPIMKAEMAVAKGWGTLATGHSGRTLAQRAGERPEFSTALAALAGGRMLPVPGGVLIYHEGQVIGAVGVTGDTSDADEEYAILGIQALGFQSDPESPQPR